MPRITWLQRQQEAQRLAREYGLAFPCPCGRPAGGIAPDGAICPECARALYQVVSDAHRLLTRSQRGPYAAWGGVSLEHTTEG